MLCYRCPKCNFTLDSTDHIFPNFLFNELVSKYKQSLESKLTQSNMLQHPDLAVFKTVLASNFDSMSLPDVELMLKLLENKKQQLAAHSVFAQKQLLKEFLQHLKKQKDEQLFALQKEAAVIQVRVEYGIFKKNNIERFQVNFDQGLRIECRPKIMEPG